jgi:hypothetical protein
MKKTGIVFACILLGIALCISSGCKKEEEEISGDSGLLVQNETGFDYDIYFDGDFIGEVEGTESRSWSVPSGNHCVDLESTTGKDFDEVCNFPSGQTVVIKITPIAKEVRIE